MVGSSEEIVRTREGHDSISGSKFWGGSPTDYNIEAVSSRQTTVSHETMWPRIEHLRRKYRGTRNMAHFLSWADRQDWGAGFRTEKTEIGSTLQGFQVSGFYLVPYGAEQKGPVYLNGFAAPGLLSTPQEVSNEQQLMFGLGGSAINRARPFKPVIDLAVTIGELRNLSQLPKMVGSILERSRTIKDVFRNSGGEYLNVQFGWAPLVRDVVSLTEYVISTRDMLKQHEREINRLIRRRYNFDPITSTVEGLSKAGTLASSYGLHSGTPLGGNSWLSTRPTVNAPVEITKTVTKSYFSGAFRIYSSDIHYLDEYLADIEDKANLLLGTRLDPEVLWNLQPWSWLSDYVFNLGNILGNISAFSDGVVLQYGYLMREVSLVKEITIPKGIWRRTGTSSWVQCSDRFTTTYSSHIKSRVKASPFGFGLNPESLSESQWAILLALGMSKGLK